MTPDSLGLDATIKNGEISLFTSLVKFTVSAHPEKNVEQREGIHEKSSELLSMKNKGIMLQYLLDV